MRHFSESSLEIYAFTQTLYSGLPRLGVELQRERGYMVMGRCSRAPSGREEMMKNFEVATGPLGSGQELLCGV